MRGIDSAMKIDDGRRPRLSWARYSPIVKQVVSVVIILCLLMAIKPAEATTTKKYKNYWYTVAGGKATITGYTSDSETTLILPDKIKGYPVTSIGASAFKEYGNLESVSIPDHVTSIGDEAFYNCENFTTLALPGSVTSIGDYAFYGCKRLTGITIPEGVSSIGKSAFSFCHSLSRIDLPESITGIGDGAFSTCDSLTSVVIPVGVTSIGDEAFRSCDSLTSVDIPESVTSIGLCVFLGCDKLDSIRISENNPRYAIRNEALYDQNSMTLVAYWGKGSDAVYPISEGTRSIGEKAFYSVDSLASIEIPSSVTSIDPKAFLDCYDLENIYVAADNAVFEDVDGVLFDKLQKMLHTYPKMKASFDMRQNEQKEPLDPPRGEVVAVPSYSSEITGGSYTIPDGTIMIGDYAFYDSIGLSHIAIPYEVTRIGDYAFYQCNVLEEITLPQSLLTIGDDAFAFCTKLTEFIIPEGVVSIGDHAFSYCFKLQNLYVPASVAEIGDDPFSQISYGSFYFSHNAEYRSDFSLWVYENSYAYVYLQAEGWELKTINDR